MSGALASDVLEPRVEVRPAPLPADAEDRASPSWRGVLHEKAFAFSPALGVLLVASAAGGSAKVAAIVFAVTMTLMLGTSVLNHRTPLGERRQAWLRRADHAAIGLFMVGTWTSVGLVVPGAARLVLTAFVGGGALAAALVTLAWVRVPGWIPAAIALAGAWSAAGAFPQVASAAGVAGTTLFGLGGLFYTAGAAVYSFRRPNVHPAFGYHELFHALVLMGLACHYLMLAFFVLPGPR
jgi:hemolysin III